MFSFLCVTEEFSLLETVSLFYSEVHDAESVRVGETEIRAKIGISLKGRCALLLFFRTGHL